MLFNRPFRKVNKGQLINSITGKNLLVEIEFEKGGIQWLVRRGSKPNIFEIHRDGTLIDQNAESKDYQGYLETVLGMNQKAFSQVVILGSASFVPFMQLTVPARREVIEDLLDIQIFSQMNILLKSKVSLNKDALFEATKNVEMIQHKFGVFEQLNQDLMNNRQEEIDGKKNKIDELTKVALQTIEKAEAEQSMLDDIRIDTSLIQKLNQEKREAEDEIMVFKQDSKASERIALFLNDHDTCPTCKQDIDADFKSSEMIKHLDNVASLASTMSDLKKKVADIEAELNEIFEIEKTSKKHQALLDEYTREIGWYQQQVMLLTEEIAEIANRKTPTDLEPLRMELKDKQSALEVRNEHTKVLDCAATLLKDSGIKAVIIKQYIPVINKLINKYLAQMDFFVDFQINEAFEETIKSRFRDEFSYESFSEGEKARIDLSILLTWREIGRMRNSCSTNILILDEVFDGSLDIDGIENLSKIMNIFKDTNIIVISHKEDFIDRFDQTIKFVKDRGYSKMVMYK